MACRCSRAGPAARAAAGALGCSAHQAALGLPEAAGSAWVRACAARTHAPCTLAAGRGPGDSRTRGAAARPPCRPARPACPSAMPRPAALPLPRLPPRPAPTHLPSTPVRAPGPRPRPPAPPYSPPPAGGRQTPPAQHGALWGAFRSFDLLPGCPLTPALSDPTPTSAPSQPPAALLACAARSGPPLPGQPPPLHCWRRFARAAATRGPAGAHWRQATEEVCRSGRGASEALQARPSATAFRPPAPF